LDSKAAALVLSRLGWLSRMPSAFQDAILEKCVWRRFGAGQSLIVAGDPPGGLVGVAEGSISAFTIFGAPDAPMVHIGQAGTWTGEGSLLSGEPRRVSVVAMSAVVAASVPLPALQAMLAERPQWWRHIGQLAQTTVDIVVNGVADMMIHDTGRRCAAILLRLSGRRFEDPDAARPVRLTLTQDTLAAMANASRSSVNPILRRLAGCGLIEVGFGSIVVIDAVALRRFANGD
jgi:CRP/FNR family transcriptional regulator, cyclic AMP receptor protein